MGKKLPEVFHNSINKKLSNNNDIFYSKDDTNMVEEKKDRKNIRKKSNDIFSSSDYVYKANVKITTSDNSFETKIIGKNKNYLITLDNKIIPIEDIIDIEKEKWAIVLIFDSILSSYILFISKIVFFLIYIVLIYI